MKLLGIFYMNNYYVFVTVAAVLMGLQIIFLLKVASCDSYFILFSCYVLI